MHLFVLQEVLEMEINTPKMTSGGFSLTHGDRVRKRLCVPWTKLSYRKMCPQSVLQNVNVYCWKIYPGFRNNKAFQNVATRNLCRLLHGGPELTLSRISLTK